MLKCLEARQEGVSPTRGISSLHRLRTQRRSPSHYCPPPPSPIVSHLFSVSSAYCAPATLNAIASNKTVPVIKSVILAGLFLIQKLMRKRIWSRWWTVVLQEETDQSLNVTGTGDLSLTPRLTGMS